jgi:predicted nicotinamide N-methyase
MDTLRRCNDGSCCALVFFTPYRPWLLDKDLDFFRLSKGSGLRVEKFLEKKMETVLFQEDPGVSTHIAYRGEALRRNIV